MLLVANDIMSHINRINERKWMNKKNSNKIAWCNDRYVQASKSLIVHKNVKDYELLKDNILVTINVELAQ